MNFKDKVYLIRLLNTELLRVKRKRNNMYTKHPLSHKYQIAQVNLDILQINKIKAYLQKDLPNPDPDFDTPSSYIDGGAL